MTSADIHAKLNLLGQAARYDDCVTEPAGVQTGAPESRGLFAGDVACSTGRDMFPYVSHVHTPDGRRKAILKVLQTSACQNNCRYCAFRAGRDIPRAHLTPDELARGFDLMARAGVVDGLFLSSGIMGAVKTMDEMLATTELVRGKYGFTGYIHLKMLPGAEPAQVARAVALADRVSANLEGPTAERLAFLAPQKALPALVGPLQTAAEILRNLTPRLSPARRGGFGSPPPSQEGGAGRGRLGLSTQFVVGPAGESDRELLNTAQALYRGLGLARAYYSAFTPVSDTPLAEAVPTHPTREFRLYQADWLLRYYNFGVDELPFGADGLLDMQVDPKTAWAEAHPERFPVEVNRASLDQLLRIPGIGPISARAIAAARRGAPLRELGDLRKLGARADRAAPYVLLSGRRPPYQPPLGLKVEP